MTRPLIVAMPDNERLAGMLAAALDGELGELEARRFPDEEVYLRLTVAP